MDFDEFLKNKGLSLKDDDGVYLSDDDGQILKGDFTRLLPRLKPNNLSKELIVKAAKLKNLDGKLTALDATAGLGEDSFILAAAGFKVTLYEKNPVIFRLLADAVERGKENPEAASVLRNMEVINHDSIEAMKSLGTQPDIILLDPMFPERRKSALVKKKLQIIQKLEMPCADEKEMFFTAVKAEPKKLIVKRPPKGDFLANVKPDYSLRGKAVRFDCFVNPYGKIKKIM